MLFIAASGLNLVSGMSPCNFFRLEKYSVLQILFIALVNFNRSVNYIYFNYACNKPTNDIVYLVQLDQKLFLVIKILLASYLSLNSDSNYANLLIEQD